MGLGHVRIDKSAPAPGVTAKLRLLATTDLHMHLTGFDYAHNTPDPEHGLTRTAALIAQARAEAEAEGHEVILLDNGDALQGTAIGDFSLAEPAADWQAKGRHPLMGAFDHLGYDAIGLGNHDFNYGLPALARVLRDAPCPVVSTNLVPATPDILPMVVPHVVLERRLAGSDAAPPVKIGILSVLPPQTTTWDAIHLRGRITVEDIVRSAARTVPVLQAQGCTVIVVLAHSGLHQPRHTEGQENAVIPLAAVPGVSAILAGHTHLLMPGLAHRGLPHVDAQAGTVHGVPVAMAGFAGSHLAQIDLGLTLDATGQWQTASAQSRVRAIAQKRPDGRPTPLVDEDPGLMRLVAPVHARAVERMQRGIGEQSQPLHSYFAFAGRDSASHLIACAQAAAVRPHLPPDLADRALISAVAPSKCGGRAGPNHYTDIAAGPLCERHVHDLVIFPNRIVALDITGAQLQEWLEMSAGLFATLTVADPPPPLVTPDWPGHGFDVIFGLSYGIDPCVPARYHLDGTRTEHDTRRIRNLQYRGKAVTPDQRFVVVLNSYRASGGGNVAALRAAQPRQLPTLHMRTAVSQYLSGALSRHALEFDRTPWTFAAPRDTRALLRTGPGARAHLCEIDALSPQDQGLDPDGFLQVSLTL